MVMGNLLSIQFCCEPKINLKKSNLKKYKGIASLKCQPVLKSHLERGRKDLKGICVSSRRIIHPKREKWPKKVRLGHAEKSTVSAENYCFFFSCSFVMCDEWFPVV